MDPTANLAKQRAIATRITECATKGDEVPLHLAVELAELVADLHTWLSRGGPLPHPWKR